MTRPNQLLLHQSALSEQALIWIFITIAVFIACVGIAIFWAALETMAPQHDQERIRAIEFWIHCG